MTRRAQNAVGKQLKLPFLAASAAVMLALPTASLALVGLGLDKSETASSPLDLFTPSSVDPQIAARIAEKARKKGLRFTPAGANPVLRDRTVTVAVRIDEEAAKAISVRKAASSVPGAGEGITALDTTRFNLGTSRGYQSFTRAITLPEGVRDLSVPDLSEFEPFEGSFVPKPSRLQPRIALEDERLAGRSANTLDDRGTQTVDLGGSFRLSSKVDVTAGVRLNQERERLGPLTDSLQDSQAVYVGAQIKF